MKLAEFVIITLHDRPKFCPFLGRPARPGFTSSRGRTRREATVGCWLLPHGESLGPRALAMTCHRGNGRALARAWPSAGAARESFAKPRRKFQISSAYRTGHGALIKAGPQRPSGR